VSQISRGCRKHFERKTSKSIAGGKNHLNFATSKETNDLPTTEQNNKKIHLNNNFKKLLIMKKNSILVKKVLMSIATAATFTFGLTACSDDNLENWLATATSLTSFPPRWSRL